MKKKKSRVYNSTCGDVIMSMNFHYKYNWWLSESQDLPTIIVADFRKIVTWLVPFRIKIFYFAQISQSCRSWFKRLHDDADNWYVLHISQGIRNRRDRFEFQSRSLHSITRKYPWEKYVLSFHLRHIMG